MNKIDFFWNKWERKEKSLFLALFFLFGMLLVTAAFFVVQGIHGPIEAVTLSKTESVAVQFRSIVDEVINIPITANNYLITQSAMGSAYVIPLHLSYVLFFLQICLIAVILAAITYLNRFWFLAAIGFIIFWFINMQLGELNVMGFHKSEWAVVGSLLFMALLYYLHAINSGINFFLRLSFIWLLLISFFGFILYFSTQDNTLFYLISTAQVLPWMIAVVFVFNIAYELIYWVLYLLTKSKTQSEGGNALHFLVMGLLLVVYIGLTYAYNTRLIDWEIVYLNEFLLLGISAVFGVWGIQRRHQLFKAQLDSEAITGILYLAMGGITFSAVIWLFATGNDALRETFEDLVIFSHLGFGLMFLIYILYNFHKPLHEGLMVYKVAFKPNKLPFFTFRFAGLIVFLALFFYSNSASLKQAISAYYTGLGDYYRLNGNEQLTKFYYRMGLAYFNNNHKANYSLGYYFHEIEKDYKEAIYYYRKAKNKEASPFTYLNLSLARHKEELIFDALFENEEALKRFPGNGYLLNNMGYMYSMVNRQDSAYYFYDKAWNTEASHLAAVNTLGFFAKYNFNIDVDSLLKVDWPKNLAAETNKLAIGNKFQRPLNEKFRLLPLDSELTYNQFSYLNNAGIYHAAHFKPDLIELTKAYLQTNDDSPFKVALQLSLAHQQNAVGNVVEAYRIMLDLQQNDAYNAGTYFYVNSLWAYEQQEYELALEYCQEALRANYTAANSLKVFILMHLGRTAEARNLLFDEMMAKSIDEEAMQNDPLYRLLVNNEASDDAFKYLKMVINKEKEIPELNEYFQSAALFYQFRKAEHRTDSAAAQNWFVQMKQNDDFKSRAAIINYLNGWGDQLPDKVNGNYPFQWETLLAALQQKDDSLIVKVAFQNPFFVDAVLYAINQLVSNDELDKAYELMVQSVRLNPHQAAYMKAYVALCLKMNLKSYAQDMMVKLYFAVEQEEYNAFERQYMLWLEELNKKFEEWPEN